MKVCRMDCPYCGASIEADVENREIVYCTYCGKQIRIENDSSNITVNQNININQSINQRVTNDAEILKEQNRHRENRWVLIIVSIILLVFVGGISALFFRKDNSTTAESNTNVKEENVKKEEPSVVQKEEKPQSDNQSTKNETTNHKESTSSSDQEKQQIELMDSGYTVETSRSYVVINYAVKIKNPNKEYAVEFPTIRITARSADGTILSTDEQVLSFMDADETILYAGRELYEGNKPNSVDISVSNPDYGFEHKDEKKASQAQFSISNVSVNKGSNDRAFTGEITNNSSEDLRSAAVIVIFKRGGKMIGGATDYADNLTSGATVPFEVSDSSSIEYDSYEVYGLPW